MKRVICLLLASIIFFTVSVPVFADYTAYNDYQITTSESDGNTRAEETTWVIWKHDGIVERRLWSITYGIWLTDWEIIGYYDP